MQYDGSLQMFIEAPRTPDTNTLKFWRWRVLNDRPSLIGDMVATSTTVDDLLGYPAPLPTIGPANLAGPRWY